METLLLGKGDGTFTPQPLVSAYACAWKAAAGDLNGDGWMDLATVTTGSETAVSVRLGDGAPDARFGPATSYPTESAPTALLLADLDDDGNADLVAAMKNRLTLWRGSSTGRLIGPTHYPVGAAGDFLVTADWNRDGVRDLLFGTPTLRILLGRGDGTFEGEIACGLALGSPSNLGINAAVADFDHDQKTDMVVSQTGVLLGMKGCNFTSRVSVLGDPVGVADLNGDGHADIITRMGFAKMVVYLGDGRGAFTWLDALAGASYSCDDHCLVGDLDRDGRLDIIAPRPEAWQVLLNTCD